MAGKLTDPQRREWLDQFRLSERFYQERIAPTKVFDHAYRSNQVFWANGLQKLGFGAFTDRLRDQNTWPYDQVTANLVYANRNTIIPQVSMWVPKVLVKPSARATRRWQRIEEEQSNPMRRYEAAAVVQVMMQWRVREFNFKRQWDRSIHDDFTRGFGACRHGFVAESFETVRLSKGGKPIQVECNPNVRPGWPYMVHQHIEEFRWDVLADDPENRQWCAFGKYWRIEDLKADPRFSVPRDLRPSHMAGSLERNIDHASVNESLDTLGRVLVWEIWDRRSHNVIYWVAELEKEIGVHEWPIEFEGLPDSMMISNETNDGIQGISEVDMFWELNCELNKLISLILIYAKRSVPLIGANRGGLNEDELEKLTDAQVLETIVTEGDPNTAIKSLSLNANFQPLILAAQFIAGIIRDVTGQSNMSHGSRENVETATEAAQIAAGGNTRVAHRVQRFTEFAARSIRTDFQILQQTRNDEDLLIDVVDTSRVPELHQVTPDQIQMEYDFEIAVNSTEPDNPEKRKRDALSVIQAAQSHPELLRQFSPRFLAQTVVDAYGLDQGDALASPEAVSQQVIADSNQMNLGGGSINGGTSNGNGLAAALSGGGNGPQ